MRTPTALVVIALAATLTGCTTPAEVIIPDPESTLTPIFESDEEALAAAEEAYAEYAAESDLVQSRGGEQPEVLYSLISPDMQESFEESFISLSESDWHTQGSSSFDTVTLQQVINEPGESATVILYLCADVSDVRLITSQGVDETPVGRDNRIPLEVEITFESVDNSRIERAEYWSGDDYC